MRRTSSSTVISIFLSLLILKNVIANAPGFDEPEPTRTTWQQPILVAQPNQQQQWTWVPSGNQRTFEFGSENPRNFQPIKVSNNRITRFFPNMAQGSSSSPNEQVSVIPRQSSMTMTPGNFDPRPLGMVQSFNNRGGPIFQASSNFEFDPSRGESTSLFQSERPPPLSGSFNTAKTSSFDQDENDPNPPEIHSTVSSSFNPSAPGFDEGTQQVPQQQQFTQFSSPPSGSLVRPASFVSDDTSNGPTDQQGQANVESSPDPSQMTGDGPEGKVSESSHVGTPVEGRHLLAGPVQSDQFGSFSRTPTSIAASTFDAKGMDTVHRLSTAVHEAPGDDLIKLSQTRRHQTQDQQVSSSFIDDTPDYHKKFESSGTHTAWHTHRSRHRTTQPTDDERVFRVGEGKGRTTTFGRTSATTFIGLETPTTEGKRTGNTNVFSTSFMDFDPTHFRQTRSVSMKDAMERMDGSKSDSPLPFVPDLETLRALWTPSLPEIHQIQLLNPHLTTLMPLIPEKPVNTDVCRDLLFIVDSSGSSRPIFKNNLELIKQISSSALLPFQKLAGLITFGPKERTRSVAEFEDRLDNLSFMRRVNGLEFLGGIGELGSAMDLAGSLIRNRKYPVDIILVSDGFSGDDYIKKTESLFSNEMNRFFVLASNYPHLNSQLYSITNGDNIYTRREDLIKLRDKLAC